MINSPAVAVNSVGEQETAVSARGDEVAASSSGRLQAPETEKKERKRKKRLQRLAGRNVRKQANSIIRPAPRVGAQLKHLTAWKV